jgi:hypothetical protein
MKAIWCVALAGTILWAGTTGRTQPAVQAATIGAVQVKEISVVEIDTSHVKVAVDLELKPVQSATLEDVRLCSLRLNGLPVYTQPLQQQIVLRKDAATALPPLYVTAQFRDLYTVDPLRRMIETQSVQVEGELTAGLRINFLEKLSLGTQHPKVAIALDQEVPVEIAGTPIERTVALAALTAIDAELQAKAAAGKYIPGMKPAWIRELEARAQSNLFVVESSYAIQQDGKSYPLHVNELGFQVGAGAVATTAEARAPWKYDADFLAAASVGAEKLEKKSLEIELRPLGQGDPLKLSAKDFALETRGTPDKDTVTPVNGSLNQIGVLRRASPGSLALLTLRTPAPAPALALAPAAVAAQQSWEQVVVFRLRTDRTTKKVFVEVLALSARREGKGIRLSEPVDSAVFGSPIVTPDGVIGLVEDEETGTLLPADLLPAPQPVSPATGR